MSKPSPIQQTILRKLVEWVRAGEIGETFTALKDPRGMLIKSSGKEAGYLFQGQSPDVFGVLDREGYVNANCIEPRFNLWTCTLTGRAFAEVDADFGAPDTSFARHLQPLAETSGLDLEIQSRCLPLLAAGSADPKCWDSAVRTAGVILENRLKTVGLISDLNLVGRDLVNAVFGKAGTLAGKFLVGSEREGYRDLFAGVVGMIRNPSAHRFLDPTPDDGGATIVFIDLLLKRLADLAKK